MSITLAVDTVVCSFAFHEVVSGDSRNISSFVDVFMGLHGYQGRFNSINGLEGRFNGLEVDEPLQGVLGAFQDISEAFQRVSGKFRNVFTAFLEVRTIERLIAFQRCFKEFLCALQGVYGAF